MYGATITPFGSNDPYDDPDGYREAARQKVNNWIRTGGRSDAVVDFDKAVRDPARPDQLQEPLQVGDWLHLTPEGYRKLAGTVSAELFKDTPLPKDFGYR